MKNSLVSGVRFALALGLCLATVAKSAAAADAGEFATQAESVATQTKTVATRAETAVAKAPGLDIAGLDIVEGRIYGVLDERLLEEVLDAFGRAMDMAYEVAAPLGGQPLSGRLDGLPAGEALLDLLRHFDYTAVWRADGTIERLKVTDLRPAYREVGGGVASAAATAAPRVQSAAVSVDEDVRHGEPWGAGLSWEEQLEQIQFMDLEALAKDTGVPIEQLYNPSPDGDVGEPEPNIALIENLLQQLNNQNQ